MQSFKSSWLELCYEYFKIFFISSSDNVLILISISNPIPYLSFMYYDDPKHLNSPFTRIPILVQRASASSIEWVVIITALFFLRVEILETIFHINLFAYGSTPVEGSSRKTNGGLPIIAIATESFLLFPPERLFALIFL